MRSLLIFSLLVTVFAGPAFAATKKNDPNAATPSYGGDFGTLFGAEQQQDEENKPQFLWQYGKKYSKKPEDPNAATKPTNLIPGTEQYIYFVRTADTTPNDATLRIVIPVSVTGCVNIIPPVVSVRTNSGRMMFKIEPATTALDKSVQYAHFQCHQGSNIAHADLKLSRSDLLANNVKIITLQTMGGSMDTYDVELSGDRLALAPKTQSMFKPFPRSGRADPLAYNFYPDNVVALYAPGAPAGVDLSDQIVGLAQSKGMVESAGLKSGPAHYFIDQAGTLAGSLAFDGNAFVGTVDAPETYQGPQGPYEHERKIAVYARRPNALD